MTVAELIEWLLTQNQSAEILVYNHRENEVPATLESCKEWSNHNYVVIC